MTYIAFTDEKKSDILPKILNELTSFSDNLKFTLNDLESDGYAGSYSVNILEHSSHFHVSKFTNKDKTRFPARIKATATALKIQRHFGKYQISHSKKVFSIVRIGNVNHFQIEVGNPNTKYFIFDTGKKTHRDLDYSYYTWNKYRYNKVSPGDLFIYRTPQKVSSSKQFYFFGAGKVKEIREAKTSEPQYVQDGDQYAMIEDPCPFENLIYQNDIEPGEITDTRKKKDQTWNHFFNNYGMNEISKEDFNFLISKGMGDLKPEKMKQEAMISAHNKIASGSFSVEDKETLGKHRGAYQKIFSDNVKNNYNHQCAITGIRTRSLLVGAHIIPWSVDKDRRMDPQNGICLSKLMDKCYEDNLISIDKNYKVRISQSVLYDLELHKQLKPYAGMKIHLPRDKNYHPDRVCLQYKKDQFDEREN